MSEEALARVFEPFFTTTPQGDGTGLGMAVTLGIVQSHGGHVQVRSKLHRGTTVEVWVPLLMDGAREPAPMPEPTPEPTHPPRTLRILVVDDEPAVGRALSRLLTSIGHEVTTETDPEYALQTVVRSPMAFDVVLTNQTMPGMTGDSPGRCSPSAPICRWCSAQGTASTTSSMTRSVMAFVRFSPSRSIVSRCGACWTDWADCTRVCDPQSRRTRSKSPPELAMKCSTGCTGICLSLALAGSAHVSTAQSVDTIFMRVTWQVTEGRHPTADSLGRLSGVAVDHQRTVYVSDMSEARVWVFDAQGRSVGSIGRRGRGPGEFESPTGAAIAPDGRLVIRDVIHVSRFNTDSRTGRLTRFDDSFRGPLFPNWTSTRTSIPSGADRRRNRTAWAE